MHAQQLQVVSKGPIGTVCIYGELGLGLLSARRWYRKLLFFYKIVHDLSLAYLTAQINFASGRNGNTSTSSQRHLEEPFRRNKVFQSVFFPYFIKIWNGISNSIKSNSIFPVHDVYGVKFLSRLTLNFSYLNEHKVQHDFKDRCMCNCGSATETALHVLLLCQQ